MPSDCQQIKVSSSFFPPVFPFPPFHHQHHALTMSASTGQVSEFHPCRKETYVPKSPSAPPNKTGAWLMCFNYAQGGPCFTLFFHTPPSPFSRFTRGILLKHSHDLDTSLLKTFHGTSLPYALLKFIPGLRRPSSASLFF